MKINGVEFDAIVAVPAVGKSYVCDNYQNFIDVDEERLRIKYYIPEGITRAQREATKGSKHWEKRPNYAENFEKRMQELAKTNKIFLAAPHPETIDFFTKNNIKFCFVYTSYECKEELINRMKQRGNSQEFINANANAFDDYYVKNRQENQSVLHYELKPGQYLLDVLHKAGAELKRKQI
ncbi:MAG: hypothetical protein ACOX6H_04105 [Christensenellales bacterium]|jgi:broad-specificity NMP kinase